MLTEDIVKYGAWLFKVDADDILSDKRGQHIMRARFALYLALARRNVALRGKPHPTGIARSMRRDHSTVVYGLERAEYIAQRDPAFATAVERIASYSHGTEDDAAMREERACNERLQVLRALHQQRKEQTMCKAEYIEETINKRLAELKSDVNIWWDGAIYGKDEPASFNVYIGDDETPFFVQDGRYLRIMQHTGRCSVGEVDSVRYYDDVADVLAEMARDGTIKQVEEEDA